MSWNEVSLGEITEVVTKGTTPSTYGMPFTDEGVNFIKAEALNGDVSLERSGFTHINEETHEKLARSKLRENDVLVTIAGAKVGECGFVQSDDLPANTNQAVGIVRVKPELANPRYIYYHFKNPSTYFLCQSIGSGQAAQPNINLTILKSFKVILPDATCQDKVVDIISAYEDLIRINNRRIQLLEESARLLYKEWFVHLRFPGHEHVKITDGVPEGWKKLAVKECCKKISYGYTASSSDDEIGPKLLRITDIVPFSINWGRIPFCSIGDKDIEKYKLHEGEIVVARTGATVGYAKRIPKHEGDVVYASYLVRFIADAEQIDDVILGVFMESDEFKGYVKANAGGAAQPNANAQVLGSAKLLVPPKNIQLIFRGYVYDILEQKRILEKHTLVLANARDILLPRLMKGELSV